MGRQSEMAFGDSVHYVQSYFPIKINVKYLYEYHVKNGPLCKTFSSSVAL